MEKINYPKLKKVSYAEEQEVKKNSILYNNTKKFNRVITQYLTIQEYASFKDPETKKGERNVTKQKINFRCQR